MTWPVFLTAAVILLGMSALLGLLIRERRYVDARLQELAGGLMDQQHYRVQADERLDRRITGWIDASLAWDDTVISRLDALERTDPGHRIAEAIRGHRFDRAGELPGFTTGMRTAAFIADDITGNDPIKQQEDEQ